MSEINVLDASAVVAFLLREKGADAFDAIMDERPSHITTVNVAEVVAKLIDHGTDESAAETAVMKLQAIVIDFDHALAMATARLRPRTRAIGASLGDRACLALAHIALDRGDKPHVITAERIWQKLSWPFKVELIRP